MAGREHPVVNCPVCGRAWWPRSVVAAMGRSVRGGFGFVARGKKGRGWKAEGELRPEQAPWLFQFVKHRMLAMLRTWRARGWLTDADIQLAGQETYVTMQRQVTGESRGLALGPPSHPAPWPPAPTAPSAPNSPPTRQVVSEPVRPLTLR